MNLSRAILVPWSDLLLDMVLVYRASVFRPCGEAVYRLIFELSGFDPAPYHAVRFLRVLAMVCAVWAASIRLTGSWKIAVVVGLFLAVHGGLWPFYSSCGFFFDLLCIVFYLAGVYLLCGRDGDPDLSVSRCIGVASCFLLAINAKEPAVSFPGAAMLIVLIRYSGWSGPSRRRAIVLLSAIILYTAAFVRWRVFGVTGLSAVGDYKLSLSVERLAENARLVVKELCHERLEPSGLYIAVAALVILGVLVVQRSVVGIGCLLIAVMSYAPLAFVPSRGVANCVIAVFWLLIAVGVAIHSIPVSASPRRLLCCALVAGVGWLQYAFVRLPFPLFGEESSLIAKVSAGVRPVALTLERGETVFITDNVFGPRFPWATQFLLIIHSKREDYSVLRPDDVLKDASRLSLPVDVCVESRSTSQPIVRYPTDRRPRIEEVMHEMAGPLQTSAQPAASCPSSAGP